MNIEVKVMRNSIFSLLLILLIAMGCGDNGKYKLKVLYVGGSPDVKIPMDRELEPDVLEKSSRERMASFEQFLKQYFNTVGIVHAKDYLPEMSDSYDVTIMDGTPRELEPSYSLVNCNGISVERGRPKYLPDNFDRPMIFIAEASDIVGKRLGVKMDWFCLCLDAHAHTFRSEHPIFKGPFEVKMSLEMQPTPTAALESAYASEIPVPDSVLMWRVQTGGYMTDETFRSGMISKSGGFEDSPDSEFISGGVSAKNLDAVAIGRHGNFLLWGFAASPRHMTEEAQRVFANAVVYMAKFAGQTPIARKYFDAQSRSYINLQKYWVSHEAWEKFADRDRVFFAELTARRKSALEKQKRGEKLTGEEKAALRSKITKVNDYKEHLAYYEPLLFKEFGANEQAYMDYYDNNRAYFYMGNGQKEIDEDVKAWEIPNNDLRLLDKAIECLEKKMDTARANRILHRYTLCRFETPKEWREWYEANKNRMFFTESGGWYFMINTQDKQVPGNDYRAMWEKLTRVYDNTSKERVEQTDDKNPVYTEMSVEQENKNEKVLAVKMLIHPGFHAYAKVASTDPFLVTSLKISLPAGWEKVGDIDYPAFKKYNDAGTLIYEGEVVFRQRIKGSGKGEVKCTMSYQCCNDQICIPPVEVEMKVAIE